MAVRDARVSGVEGLVGAVEVAERAAQIEQWFFFVPSGWAYFVHASDDGCVSSRPVNAGACAGELVLDGVLVVGEDGPRDPAAKWTTAWFCGRHGVPSLRQRARTMTRRCWRRGGDWPRTQLPPEQ